MLARAGLLDEAHAAMHLHTDRRHLDTDIGAEALGNRGQQFGHALPGLRHIRVRMAAGIVQALGIA